MNTRKSFFIIIVTLLAAVLVAACGGQATQAPTAMPAVRLTAPPTFPPTLPPSETPSATPVLPTPTPPDPAKDALYAFFAALDAKDYEAAAAQYSNFSLMVGEVTRGEAAAELKELAQNGQAPANGIVLESRPFDERTSLVHVQYAVSSPGGAAAATVVPGAKDAATSTATATAAATTAVEASPTVTLASGSVDQTRQAEMVATNDALPTPTAVETTPEPAPANAGPTTMVDEWWAVRQESGQWRINRDKLIDFVTLDVPVQTTAGLTVKPRQLTRYTDHLRLTLLVQNQTGGAIVLGQPNEVMATFLFGGQQVEAESQRLIFAGLHSYPEAAIDLKGLYETFPDGVIIRQWKNLQVKPWFEFQF